MNFLKMFSASMLAWIVGIVGIFVFAIGSLVSSLLNMNMGEVGIKEESVLYINIGDLLVLCLIHLYFYSVIELY